VPVTGAPAAGALAPACGTVDALEDGSLVKELIKNRRLPFCRVSTKDSQSSKPPTTVIVIGTATKFAGVTLGSVTRLGAAGAAGPVAGAGVADDEEPAVVEVELEVEVEVEDEEEEEDADGDALDVLAAAGVAPAAGVVYVTALLQVKTETVTPAADAASDTSLTNGAVSESCGMLF
jgi:hypothetical protein